MNQTKKILLPLFSLLLSVLFLAIMPTDAEAGIYTDTVRLHILANSDSEEDQQIKLSVRDALLSTYGERLCHESCEDAKEISNALLPEMEEFTRQTLRKLGADYDVRITLTEEWYDTRTYENFTMPKGYYTSLRVILGEGDGQNWWCVMFPPLCKGLATDAPIDDGIPVYTEEEKALITGGSYQIKFKTLELICSLFR